MFKRTIDDDLELALLEERHAAELYGLVHENRGHIREWMTWVPVDWSVPAARRLIRGALERFADGNGFWAGLRFEQKLAGCVILNQIDWGHLSADIGYWLGREYQGQGIVTRGVEAVIQHCFEDLALHRLEIRVAQENVRSRRIPERLGFREEGLLRQANRLHGTYVDLVVFSLLAHEWDEDRR